MAISTGGTGLVCPPGNPSRSEPETPAFIYNATLLGKPIVPRVTGRVRDPHEGSGTDLMHIRNVDETRRRGEPGGIRPLPTHASTPGGPTTALQ